MVNKVILLGNLGRDPELRTTQSGQPVANFSMATSRTWKDKSGQKQEETEWHQLVAWGRNAEVIGQYVHKRMRLFVEGRLKTSSWDDRETGVKKYKTEIVVEKFQMLGGPQGSSTGRSGAPEYQGSGGGSTGVSSDDYGDYGDDEDLPF